MGCGCGGKACRHRFTMMDPAAWRGTLAGSTVVDVEEAASEIESSMGFRPYQVRVVRVRFAGGWRGDGPGEVVQEVPVLPTPKVVGLDGITRVVTAAQVIEQGTIVVDSISGHYTEDQLAARATDGSPVSQVERTFWEVTFLASAGQRMRFHPVGHPTFDPDRGCWKVTLERQQADRARDGSLR